MDTATAVPDQVLGVARNAARGFKNLECVACANAVVEALKTNGIAGSLIEVRAKGGRDFIAADRFKDGTEAITQNGRHRAVLVGDTVFDNLSPNGIPAKDFFDDLHAIEGVGISVTKF